MAANQNAKKKPEKTFWAGSELKGTRVEDPYEAND